MTPVAAQVSITMIIPMLSAIANRQWEQFKASRLGGGFA
jgi:hypothetical protein